MYNIRSDKGILIAKIPNNVANMVINQSQGTFIPIKDKVAFEIYEDNLLSYDNIKIYLWKKYLLIPE